MEQPEQRDFFVSYNYRDTQWAEWIAWELEHAGYTCTIKAWDFVPGANFIAEMHHALLRCQRLIAVISANYLTSAFVTAEWTSAYADDPDGKRHRLLPIRVEEVEIGGLLKAVVHVDLVGKDEEAARQAILEAAELHRRKPTNAPSFPNRQHRLEFPQTNRTGNSGVVRFAIVLTGTVDELNKPLVEAIMKHLRQFAPDSQLTLEHIQRGSIILTFRAARMVFVRLQMWFTAEYAPLLLGMSVRRIFLLSTEGARTNSERPSNTTQTESKQRFDRAAVLYFALNEVLGPDFLCTLAAYLNFEDDELRKATVRFLLDLADFSDATLPVVLASLPSRDSVMRDFIEIELRSRGDLGYTAVAALLAPRTTTEKTVEAIAGLGYQRPARVAADALAILEVQDSYAARNLTSLLLERLSRGQTDEADDVSLARVVWSLSRMTRSAESADDRVWAIRSLARLNRMDSGVRHALRTIGMDDRLNIDVCVTAIQALVETGDVTPDLADRLLELITKTDETEIADAAVKPLAVLRSANADMLDGLISLLSMDNISVRRAAVRVIGSVGYNSATVVPVLTSCLSDEDAVVRESAQRALQRIERDMHVAAVDLESLLTAEDDTIRQRARDILSQLRGGEQ